MLKASGTTGNKLLDKEDLPSQSTTSPYWGTGYVRRSRPLQLIVQNQSLSELLQLLWKTNFRPCFM